MINFSLSCEMVPVNINIYTQPASQPVNCRFMVEGGSYSNFDLPSVRTEQSSQNICSSTNNNKAS